MNILKHFRNPWEAATEVLKTSVLRNNVLNTDVLDTGILKRNILWQGYTGNDYELNAYGYIRKLEDRQNQGFDRLIRGVAKYDKKGELKGREGAGYIVLNEDVFDDLEIKEQSTYFSMPSGEQADILFEFIARTVVVEYAKADVITGDDKRISVFVTSHQWNRVMWISAFLEGKKKSDPKLQFVSLIHNHPDPPMENTVGSYAPSGEPNGKDGDLPQARELNKLFSDQETPPRYFIWRNDIRTEYNELGRIKG
jgi:hypothetical protein